MAQKIDQTATGLDLFIQNDLRAARLMALGSEASMIHEEITQVKLEIRAAQHIGNDHAALELFEQLKDLLESLKIKLHTWADSEH